MMIMLLQSFVFPLVKLFQFLFWCPGSVHDVQVANGGNIYKNLKLFCEMTIDMCAAESAFWIHTYDLLIKPSQDPLMATCESIHVIRHKVRMQREQTLTLMNQAAEWEIRAIESFFYKEGKGRRIMIQMMILLSNLRSEMVRINQICNTHMFYFTNNTNDPINKIKSNT